MAIHSSITGSDNHALYALSYATAAAREAVTTLTAADIGKVAFQQDDDSFWLLESASPLVWRKMAQGLLKGNLDATSGLTVAASPFDLGIILPINAYVVKAFHEVLTTFVSGSDAATIGLGVASDDADGIVTAIAISDGTNPWDAGLFDATPDGTVGNFTVKTTATRQIQAALAVEDLTDGELNLFLEYIVSS